MRGTKAILSEALKKADPSSTAPIHLSFDVDVFDRQDAPATGTPVENGPQLGELFKLGSELATTGRLKSMDVVELNPQIGNKEQILKTFFMTMEFVENTLKKAVIPQDFFAMPVTA